MVKLTAMATEMITLTKSMLDAGVAAYRDWEDEKVLIRDYACAANEVAVERLVIDLLRRVFDGRLTLHKEIMDLLNDGND